MFHLRAPINYIFPTQVGGGGAFGIGLHRMSLNKGEIHENQCSESDTLLKGLN
jgi:hypothetical protein